VSIDTVGLVYLVTPLMFGSGGTAACVTAGRLAQAAPTMSILLVESGQNNLHNPTVVNPAMYLTHLTPGSQTALFYKANAEEALNGREAVVSAGGILGGGSSINFMMYTRAQGIDFDDWNTEGWDSKSLLPYMKKVVIYGKSFAIVEADQTSLKIIIQGVGTSIKVCMATMGLLTSRLAHTSNTKRQMICCKRPLL
jgi:hypothetical protein